MTDLPYLGLLGRLLYHSCTGAHWEIISLRQGQVAQESRPAFTVPLSLNLPWVPWDLRPAEPSSASTESLGFLT